MRDDDWEQYVSSPRPGIDPVSVRARCPECRNGMGKHKAWASEVEGDLIQCTKVYDHWWVRSAAKRQEERDENA